MSNRCTKPMVLTNKKTGVQETVPCGQCIGCRLERAAQWAVRCMNEASLYDDNSFITLTYSPENLPADNSINKTVFKNFMRRVAYKFPKLRYYGCGEYGTVCSNCALSQPLCRCGKWSPSIGRPHYHAILFGVNFGDKELLRSASISRLQRHFRSDAIHDLYRSSTLESLWTFGYSTIGEVTFESAGYCARYVLKKILGKGDKSYYQGRQPEFALMSRSPGIGKKWFDEYWTDIYPKDYFQINGHVRRPPRYYDELLKKLNRPLYNTVKANRQKKRREDDDGLRLYQLRNHKKLTTKTLIRSLENE